MVLGPSRHEFSKQCESVGVRGVCTEQLVSFFFADVHGTQGS